MAQRRLGRSLWNLVLAVLNATLLLLALCLWLGWAALSTAERAATQLEAAAQTVLPLRAEVVDLTAEMAAIRAELAALRADNTAERAALTDAVAGVEAQLAQLTATIADLAPDPDALIERGVSATFDALGAAVVDTVRTLRPEALAPGG